MRLVALAILLTGLAGCADRGLHRLDHGLNGPDEFSVLPTQPLVIPEVATLPPPTPGAANRTDPRPLSDAVIALGGNPAAAVAGGVPAGDSALVAAASAEGRSGDIRQVLAAEDAAYRSRATTFLSFGQDRYFRAYRGMALDAYAELERLRAAGAAVPSAPPND
ncbi:DUF3035 domain-containing protein [Pseudoroseicyclus tamaricis]|uniref:DUF3035 domain-containing protein n=1 Tax=Pseudoroseicyclus tamaricis TaxID=2705421 RepID=A0A6B2K4C8_9RHOB|nr:DUF3035 domain-containing protein [Pseudoroseicyclus tamaricis]NDV02682.1 DUF3035 domain-containing protein [Pseudoroseicyclus tamaricis]